MIVWLLDAGELVSNLVGVFSTEAKANAVKAIIGEAWWTVEEMPVDHLEEGDLPWSCVHEVTPDGVDWMEHGLRAKLPETRAALERLGVWWEAKP